MRRSWVVTIVMGAMLVGWSPTAAVAAEVPPAGTEQGGSSFTWVFDGARGVYSRPWTTVLDRDIWVDIDTFTPCTISGLGSVRVRVRLFRDDWGGWEQVGSDREFLACGGGDYVWRGVDPETYDARVQWLFKMMSPRGIGALLPEAADLEVDVWLLPHLGAVNLVVHGLLGQGVAASTRFDPQAKGLGEWLRSRLVSIEESLV